MTEQKEKEDIRQKHRCPRIMFEAFGFLIAYGYPTYGFYYQKCVELIGILDKEGISGESKYSLLYKWLTEEIADFEKLEAADDRSRISKAIEAKRIPFGKAAPKNANHAGMR